MSSNSAGEAVALRAELYAARRSAGALQKELDTAIRERDRLFAELQDCRDLHKAQGHSDSLRAEYEREAAARQAAEEVAERVSLERQRLQRARDELASGLLAAQQRAAEAEEDQHRAEQQAAALQEQLQQLRSQLDASRGGEHSSAPPDGGEGLRQQLEVERRRNAVLVAALSSAKAERDAAQMDAASARQSALHSAGPPSSNGVAAHEGPANGPASMARSDLSAEGAGDQNRALAALQRQVAQLKASRDKLIAQVNVHLSESDRMAAENTALSQALEAAREAGDKWEAQCQEALGQLEVLKDLLEESALWQGSPAASSESQQPAASTSAVTDNGTASRQPPGAESAEGPAAGNREADGADAHAQLEQRYVQECARSAALDLQVRALCAELNRAAAVTGDLSRSVLPALAGVEARLSQIAQLKAGR